MANRRVGARRRHGLRTFSNSSSSSNHTSSSHQGFQEARGYRLVGRRRLLPRIWPLQGESHPSRDGRPPHHRHSRPNMLGPRCQRARLGHGQVSLDYEERSHRQPRISQAVFQLQNSPGLRRISALRRSRPNRWSPLKQQAPRERGRDRSRKNRSSVSTPPLEA